MGKKTATRGVNHCLNLISDGRVEKNGALKEENNGWNRWVGLGFWNYRSHSISSTRKTYKDFETKGNSRRRLQRRVMHQTNLLNHSGIRQTELPFNTDLHTIAENIMDLHDQNYKQQ